MSKAFCGAGTGSLLGLGYGVQRFFCDGVCVIQK